MFAYYAFGLRVSYQKILNRGLHISTRHLNREYLDITQQYEAKLSEDEVKALFDVNAVNIDVNSSSVTNFCANQIAVNRPVEDRWNASRIGHSMQNSEVGVHAKLGGLLFSVTDGHAGHACAHAVNLRHHDYVTAALLDPVSQERVQLELRSHDFPRPHTCLLTESFLPGGAEPWGHMSPTVSDMHTKQIRRYIEEMLSMGGEESEYDSSMCHSMITDALLRMDMDMVSAAIPTSRESLDRALLRIVLSGCVNTLLYLPSNRNELTLAQVGDCEAVVGCFEDDTWTAEKLVEPHNAQNEEEVLRLQAEHPLNEANFLLRDDRLLGELMPLRAFGDVRYKWKATELKYVASILNIPPSTQVMPSFYYTPPYLTARPQVVTRQLKPGREQFVILATDGLWDELSPGEAVKVVVDGLANDIPHSNMATKLIQAALGGSREDIGGDDVDYMRISSLLSMPANVARFYRDDITVVVVFLDPTHESPPPN